MGIGFGNSWSQQQDLKQAVNKELGISATELVDSANPEGLIESKLESTMDSGSCTVTVSNLRGEEFKIDDGRKAVRVSFDVELSRGGFLFYDPGKIHSEQIIYDSSVANTGKSGGWLLRPKS